MALLVSGGVVGGSPASLRAQDPPPLRIPETLELVEPRAPLERARDLEAAIVRDSSNVVLRRQAAEVYSLAAMMEPDRERQRDLGYRGRDHAMAATALDPLDVESHYWWSVASGLAADVEGGRTQVRLAAESWDQAGWVLAADSTHAGAHHIRGRIHASVQRLNSFVRWLARVLLGAETVDQTSWEGAVHHLERAVRFDPVVPLFHYDLAVVYGDVGRREDMVSSLRAAMAAPGRSHPRLDGAHRERAAALLAAIEPRSRVTRDARPPAGSASGMRQHISFGRTP